ncbi:hypothetical protein [Kineothrix alysoides]|uniref:hypothetical protein n=1 Tax=Kineothrix alysoides TaxID=1469948 RepID=UPI0004DB7EBA|nr:hypothetical protein [Kineothrix alysoides]
MEKIKVIFMRAMMEMAMYIVICIMTNEQEEEKLFIEAHVRFAVTKKGILSITETKDDTYVQVNVP